MASHPWQETEVKNLVGQLTRAIVPVLGLLFVLAVPTPAAADDVGSSSSGNGVISGNNLAIDADAPITICGLVVALMGAGVTNCSPSGPVTVNGTTDSVQSKASGNGIVSGNSVGLDFDMPIVIQCVIAGYCGAPPDCGQQCVPTCCVPPTTCCVPPTTCVCIPSTTTTVPTSTTSSSSTSSTSSTSSSSISSSSSSSTVPTSSPPSTSPSGPQLPVTGSNLVPALPLAAALIAVGATCVWAARRQRAGL
jgi:hypothetical protein